MITREKITSVLLTYPVFERHCHPHHPASKTCRQVYQLRPSGYDGHGHRHRSPSLVKFTYLIVTKFDGPFFCDFRYT